MPVVTVDVLLVSFNTRDLLRECLESLGRHLPPRDVATVTVSVYDNDSQDGSADMVAAEFPAVQLVRGDRNIGFAAANNAMARFSSAEYLMPLNTDTRLEEDVIGPLLAVLRADPKTVVVGPRLVYPTGETQASSQDFPTLAFELARDLDGTKLAALLARVVDLETILKRTRQIDRIGERDPRETDFLWATCWLLRASALDGGALFDSKFITYDEDLDFCRRVRRRGGRIVYAPAVTLVHHGGASSTSARKRRLSRHGRRTYYEVHGGRLQALAYRLAGGIDLLKAPRRREAGA